MRKASAILNPRKLFLEVVSELVHAAPSRVTIPPWLEPLWNPWKRLKKHDWPDEFNRMYPLYFFHFFKAILPDTFYEAKIQHGSLIPPEMPFRKAQRLSRSHSTIITTLWPCSGEKHPKHLAQHCNRGRQDDLLEKSMKNQIWRKPKPQFAGAAINWIIIDSWIVWLYKGL